MDAIQYPITFGYGATDGQYYGPNGSIGPYHRGEDRAMPIGTPVIVNGVQIGLSGNTGAASGPHLHIGRFLGGHDTSPNGGGFHFASAVVTELGNDSLNGRFVRIQGDGASWVYLHLSEQTVEVGRQLNAPAAPAHPYTIQPIDQKRVRLNKSAHKWGMNYDNFTAMANNPEGDAAAGDIKTVVAICHHHIGYNYYLEDVNVPSGYNTLDCDDYTAPAPPAPVLPLPPAGALVAPSGELYAVVKRIPGYLTSGQAKTRQNSNSTVDIGSYNVYNRYNDMINVTKKPGYAGWWINPGDNVPEPFVSAFTATAADTAGATATVSSVTTATMPADDPQPDWHTTYHPFVDKYGRRTPRKYVSIANYVVKDLDTRKADVPLPTGWIVWVGGTFTIGKTVYARPQDATDRFLWYGIPLDEGIIDLYDKVYSTKTTAAERQTMHAMKPLDYLAMAVGQLEKFWNMLTFQNKKVI